MDNQIEKFADDHPAKEKFLSFIDGELAPREAWRFPEHLEACWSCRVRAAKIEETIENIIEFENAVSLFQNLHRAPKWSNFDSRLNALAREIEEKSFKSKFYRYGKQTKQILMLGIAGKLAASSLAALLIAALIYQLVIVPPVSANEILEKAAAERQEKLQAADQPVIYQKVKVSTQGESAIVEVWNEIIAEKTRKSIDEKHAVWQEFETAMTANGLNALEPLSVKSFTNWRSRFTRKRETVGQVKTPDETADAFQITTIIDEPSKIGEITQASLTVRQSDWHPISQTALVKTDAGAKVFEVSELEFRVLARKTLDKNFFGDQTEAVDKIKPVVKPNASPIENPSPAPFAETKAEKNSAAVSSNAPQATTDLEVEVLSLLNQAKADLGEQITVRRENGLLRIIGLVETSERKKEILNVLQSVVGNPSVKIEIQTVAEALAAEKNNSKLPTTVQELQTENESMAAENELIEYFGSPDKARFFAVQTVNRSGRALSRAYALKRLAQQFKPEELGKLSPAARAKWLELIRQHARAFQTETESLRGELQKIFGAPVVGAADTPQVDDISDVPRAVESLLSFASTNDRVVRSAMTVSAGEMQFSAIKTAQFRQSLKTAESIAAKLQRVK